MANEGLFYAKISLVSTGLPRGEAIRGPIV